MIWQKKSKIFSRFFIILVLSCLIFVVFLFFLTKGQKTLPQAFQNALLLFISFALAIFLLALLGIFLGINTVKTVEKMLKFTEKIKKGDFTGKVSLKRKDEIGRLALNLEEMQEALSKSFIQIQKEKEKALSIIKNMGEGVIVFDKDFKIEIVNSKAEELLTQKANELIGKKRIDEVLKLYSAKNDSIIDFPLKTGSEIFDFKKLPRDIYIIDKYQRKKNIEGNISPFSVADHRLSYILTISDVTTEKEIEKMKSEFISITSHQLRTPLSSVRWYIEMLLNGDAGKLTTPQKDFLADSHQSILTAVDLINNLLDLSRIEEGKFKYSLEPTQIEEIVDKIISDFSNLAKATNITIKKTHQGVVTPKANIDPKRIYQTISNFVNNAMTYSSKPGKKEIILSLKKVDNNIVFSCQDFGIGIPQEEQKNIFKKFFRGSNTAGVGTPGSGVGLYICKYFIEQMGGEIWFESEGQDKGTTFYFSLPIML